MKGVQYSQLNETHQRSSRNKTQALFDLVKKHGGSAAARPAQPSMKPEFLVSTSNLVRKMNDVSDSLEELNRLAKSSTLFNMDDNKIGELINFVNRSISEMQTSFAHTSRQDQGMAYSNQSSQSGAVIKDILNLRLIGLTNRFKQALQQQSEVLKSNEAKKGKFQHTATTNPGKFREESRAAHKGPRFLAKDSQHRLENTANVVYNRGADLEGSGSSTNGELTQEFHERKNLEKRAVSMKKIEGMLHEVGHIFQKLGTIVKMHEVMIDRIDKNTEDTLYNIEKGKGQLIQIHKDVSSYRGLMIKVFLMLLVFSVIYIIFLL